LWVVSFHVQRLQFCILGDRGAVNRTVKFGLYET
jgi:hypothetical protein